VRPLSGLGTPDTVAPFQCLLCFCRSKKHVFGGNKEVGFGATFLLLEPSS
jgi:hypothetical protein